MKDLDKLLPDIHYLADYKADERNYGSFGTNVIFCCHKINDIYVTYGTARANLFYFSNEDFGDFAKDEVSIRFVRFQLIQNALFYYNILIDLSWQFLWFFYQYDVEGIMPTTKLYDTIAKECTLEKLRYRLTLARDIKIRDHYVDRFFNDKLAKELREMYNFVKHRGRFYCPGLGLNDNIMSGRINNMDVPLVSRRELNLEETLMKLVSFDKLYFEYISTIIKMYMPKDFIKYNDIFSSSINYYFSYKEQLIAWNKKNKNK